MDMLERSRFLSHLSPGEVFMSPHEAVVELTGEDPKTKKRAKKQSQSTTDDKNNGALKTPPLAAAKETPEQI